MEQPLNIDGSRCGKTKVKVEVDCGSHEDQEVMNASVPMDSIETNNTTSDKEVTV